MTCRETFKTVPRSDYDCIYLPQLFTCNCTYLRRLFTCNCTYLCRLFTCNCTYLRRLFTCNCTYLCRLFTCNCTYLRRLFTCVMIACTLTGSLHITVCTFASCLHVTARTFAGWLHPGGCVDSVTKQTVPRHLESHHACAHRTYRSMRNTLTLPCQQINELQFTKWGAQKKKKRQAYSQHGSNRWRGKEGGFPT